MLIISDIVRPARYSTSQSVICQINVKQNILRWVNWEGHMAERLTMAHMLLYSATLGSLHGFLSKDNFV